jgi:activator of HSP90 ATPase
MKTKHESKAQRLRDANRVLMVLLRNPKTRGGLVAMAQARGLSASYVYGWLTERQRSGVVTKLKSGAALTYQLTSHVVVEVPAEGLYPAWLDPRVLPVSVASNAYINGRPASEFQEEKEDEE